MIFRTHAAAAALVALSVAGPIQAQQGVEGPDRQELLERIEQEFEQRIASELELTAEQREALPQVFTEFASQRRELWESRTAYMARVGVALEAEQVDPVRAMTLIEEGRALRAREEDLRVQEEERLLAILDPSQVLVLQVVRDQFIDLIEAISDRSDIEQLIRGERGTSEPPDER